jgi:sn-glycerol 3-phosphate transport system substrate-binding protein
MVTEAMRRWRVPAVAGALVLASVPTTVAGASTSAGAGASKPASDCPVGALAKAEKPVTITVWHALTAGNENVLGQLVSEFEAAQPDVRVKLVAQNAYPELLEKYKAGLSSGDLPDVGQFEDTTVQTLVDSKSTISISACIKADKYDTSDFLPRTLDFYKTQGVQRSMPWNVSNPVLFYNRNAFRQAGLDPDKPPQTLDEVKEYAQKIKAAGYPYGIALHAEPYLLEFLYAKSGLQLVNNGNGRSARATKAQLDSKKGRQVWSWWDDMVKSGLAVNTGSQANNYDHVFAVGNGNAAMTFEASGVLGPAANVLASGQFPNVEAGVGPLPALQSGGAVPVGDGSLWIPKHSSPEKRAAAWEFIKFLSDPARQAELSVGSSGGYIPVRKSSVDEPALQQLWSQKPYLRVPYDQLESGPTTPATVGSVIGNFQGFRDAERDGLTRMLTENVSPKDALKRTQNDATAAIADYNARVGG